MKTKVPADQAAAILRSDCTRAVIVTTNMTVIGTHSIQPLRPVLCRNTASAVRTRAPRSWLAEPKSGQMFM